jgi:hypothetical protein
MGIWNGIATIVDVGHILIGLVLAAGWSFAFCV